MTDTRDINYCTSSIYCFLDLFLFIWLCQVLVAVGGVQFPAGSEPWSPALGARSLSHWTTREVPVFTISGKTSYQPAQKLILSFLPFLLGELCCQGKGASFLFHNYFLLLRGVIPKLLRQHSLLTILLSVSDPGSPSNSWRRLWHLQEPEHPLLT